jgi:hypothetical protein
MCEAWMLTQEPRYRRSAQRAVDACLAARSPGRGWRYEPRGEESDTNVTTAMLHVLAIAERGGLEVDPRAVVEGGRFLVDMTDGWTGYNVRGGWSARPEGLHDKFPVENSGAMPAAGLFGFSLVARHGIEEPDVGEALDMCRKLLPFWGPQYIDMYYWYWGTLAFHARGGKDWSKWSKALAKALVPYQRKSHNDYVGSWDPAGPWGPDGGRIYSTALMTLALATPCRMDDDYLETRPKGNFAHAANALADIAKHTTDPDVRARAELWLRRAGR